MNMYKNTMHPEQPFLLGKLYSKPWEIECRMAQREAAAYKRALDQLVADGYPSDATELVEFQERAAAQYAKARQIFERNT